jgi:hypothetical protein
MPAKQIEVDCPCCDARLLIDVLTSKVLRHSMPEQRDELGKPILDEGRWDKAQDRIRARTSGAGQDKFDAALGREKSRSSDLDDLFKKAKDKLDKREKDLDS